MSSGRKYSITRLRPYTYTETRCRICDRRIESDKLNPHLPMLIQRYTIWHIREGEELRQVRLRRWSEI